MSRIELIPENAFATEFKQLRQELENFKNTQRVGKDVVVPFVIEVEPAAGYDIQADPEVGGQYLADYEILFEADHQESPWGVPFVRYFVNGPTTPALNSHNIGGTMHINIAEIQPGRIGYTAFAGGLEFNGVFSLYIKVYFYATDTGVLTVTKI